MKTEKPHYSGKLDKAILAVENGMSLSAAAKKYGVIRATLTKYCGHETILSRSQEKNNEMMDKKNQARTLRSAGMSYSKIAKQVNISEASVKSWCDDIILTEDQVKANLGRFEDQKLAIQYRLEGMYIPEIARKLKCSKGSVSLWLKNANIQNEVNEKVETRKKNERLAKATKNMGGENVFQETVEKIIAMRLGGMSFAEISTKLSLTVDFVQNSFSSNYNLSEEEKAKVTALVKKRTLERKRSGELKATGGFKQGCERSKFGHYKGIYCSSTYELCWVIYRLDHQQEAKRFPGFLESQKPKFKYYPDFLVDENHIIEIKGYEDKYVSRKTKLAQSLGYKVTVMKKEDLKEIFEYVDKNYGTTKYNRFTLYDNHKAKYDLICDECKKEFDREKLNKYKYAFCSQSCAAKFRIKNSPRQNWKSSYKTPLKLSKEQAQEVFVSKDKWSNIMKDYKISRGLVASIKSKKSYTWIHA